MIEVLEKPTAGPVIRLHEGDNVLIARSNIEIGAKVTDGITARSQVPSPPARCPWSAIVPTCSMCADVGRGCTAWSRACPHV